MINQSKVDLSGVLRVLRTITADQRAINRAIARETVTVTAAGGLSALASTRRRYSALRHQTALSAKARAIQNLRAEAAQMFPGGLVCDPGFDVLLDLFIASEEGDQRFISDRLKPEVPATTKLRWINRLEDEGLIERHPDPLDRRRCFIKLTEESRSKVRDLVEQSRLYVPDSD